MLNLSLVKYICDNYPITDYSMCIAVKYGHLDNLKYLHKTKKYKYSKDIFDNSAKYGHIHIVKYLHKHKYHGTDYLIDYVIHTKNISDDRSRDSSKNKGSFYLK